MVAKGTETETETTLPGGISSSSKSKKETNLKKEKEKVKQRREGFFTYLELCEKEALKAQNGHNDGNGGDDDNRIDHDLPDETFILFVGESGAGKSSLIQLFLCKDGKDTTPTVALDYHYARKSKPGMRGEDSMKDTAHIWELGGAMCQKDMVAAPLIHNLNKAIIVIVLDLTKVENIIPSLKKWLDVINQAFGKNKNSNETRNGLDLDIPLMIVANKYDLFKNEDSAKRKIISLALRFLTRVHRASLVFASIKDKVARENYKSMSKQRFFSTVRGGLDYWSRYGKSFTKTQLQHLRNGEGPILVYPGTDSAEKILSSLPISITKNVMQKDKFTKSNKTKAMDQWMTVSKALFGKHNVVDYETEMKKVVEMMNQFPNPVIDEAKAYADREFEQAARQMELSRQVILEQIK